MPEHSKPGSEEAFQKVQEEVAVDLLLGRSKRKIVKELLKNKWPEDTANEFVDALAHGAEGFRQSPRGREMLTKHYSREVLHGALWAIGGIALTVATFAISALSPVGGVVVVAWPAVVYGCYRLFKGVVGWLKHRA